MRPKHIDGEWTYIDLELNPHAYNEGRVEIRDEDEFVDACAAGVISLDEAMVARAAADKVARCMLGKIEPFEFLGWQKLDEALCLKLPPLTSLG